MPGVYYATRAGCTELCWEWWGGRSVCFRLHHYGGLVSTASVSHSPGSGWAWSAVCPVGLLGFLFPAAHHLVELWPSGGHMLFLLFTNHQLESSEDISDRVAFSSHIRSKIFPVLLQKLNLFTCKFVYYLCVWILRNDCYLGRGDQMAELQPGLFALSHVFHHQFFLILCFFLQVELLKLKLWVSISLECKSAKKRAK